MVAPWGIWIPPIGVDVLTTPFFACHPWMSPPV